MEKAKVRQSAEAKPSPTRLPEWFWPAIVIAANILLGILIASRYGLSFDEPGTIIQGDRTLQAYARLARPTDWYKDLGYYGPFYFALAEVGARLVAQVRSAWTLEQARHFFYFLTFQASIPALYYLCRRVARRSVALIAVVLFGSQPLLFGHAFINPKDTPFLTFFLLAMASGIALAERLGSQGMTFAATDEAGGPIPRSVGSSLRQDWSERGQETTVAITVLAILGILAILDVYVFHAVLLPVTQWLVRVGYADLGRGLLGRLFSIVAQDAAHRPLEAYLAKVTHFYQARAQIPAILALTPALLAMGRVFLPTLARIRPRGAVALVFLAGAFLGLATSIRVAAPLAGLLVSVLILARARGRGLVPLIAYWMIAGAACYITWPFLWGAPLAGFVQSWQKMSDFPWNHQVLFQGTVYLAGQLPWTFKVIFVILQLTEPVLILALLGTAAAWVLLRRRALDAWLLLVLATWCLLPFVTAILTGATAYDNSRQFLFALPPLFVMAAIALESIFARLTHIAWRLGIAAVILLPGMLAIVRLNPYEYVYFNSLAGGVRGAYRYYELDYWGTAYRDAMGYVNAHASPNALIGIADPWMVGMFYARPDLRRWISGSGAGASSGLPEYAVLTTRSNVDLDTFPQAKVVYAVSVEGAVLAVVQQVSDPSNARPSPLDLAIRSDR